jgi:hypothetical protein
MMRAFCVCVGFVSHVVEDVVDVRKEVAVKEKLPGRGVASICASTLPKNPTAPRLYRSMRGGVPEA